VISKFLKKNIGRKLSENLLAKAIKSPAAQQLTFELKLNDQLCQLHYNNFVVYDRGIVKLRNKRKNSDLLYYPKDTKRLQFVIQDFCI
jgi:hypothetical protein